LRLYRHADRFRDGAPIAPLLFRIAINLARTAARRARLWRMLVPRLAAAEPMSGEASDEDALRSELHGRVRAAIARLPPRYREAVLLRDIEEWNYAEIATALGCPEGTLKSRIGRGREMLRRELGPYWEAGRGRKEGSGRG